MLHLWQAEWCISSSSLFVQFPSHWITASCRTAFQEISGTQRCSFSSKSRKTDGVALCPRRVDKNRINTTRESSMRTCFWTPLPLFFFFFCTDLKSATFVRCTARGALQLFLRICFDFMKTRLTLMRNLHRTFCLYSVRRHAQLFHSMCTLVICFCFSFLKRFHGDDLLLTTYCNV